MKRLNLILIILLLFSGAVFFVYHFIWNKSHPDYADLTPDFTMTAQDLYSSFTNDAEKASGTYNGKMILLSGDISRVERVDSLVIAVYVFNEGMFGDEGVRCTFLANEADLVSEESLAGKSIKGFCTGFNDVDVILEKCTINK